MFIPVEIAGENTPERRRATFDAMIQKLREVTENGDVGAVFFFVGGNRLGPSGEDNTFYDAHAAQSVIPLLLEHICGAISQINREYQRDRASLAASAGPQK